MKYVFMAAAFAVACAAPASAQVYHSVGDCMSDGLYGNQPNMADGTPGGPSEQTPGSQAGNVLPSQSPGPFTNNPNDPDNPTPGRSAGDYHQEFGGGIIPELCRSVSG